MKAKNTQTNTKRDIKEITAGFSQEMKNHEQTVTKKVYKSAVFSSLLTTIVLIVLAIGSVVFFLGPKFLDDMNVATKEQMAKLEQKYKTIEEKQQELASMQNNLISQVTHLVTGDLSAQIQQIQNLSAQVKLVNDRIVSLQKTSSGQTILDNSVADLQTMILGTQDRVDTLETKLEKAKEDNDALADVLEGITGNDLKAAAMLLAVGQLRQTLNSEQNFETDLATVQALVGDDPEMLSAIQKMAPYANVGILDRQTLSSEFRGLTKEILLAGLAGEDLSLKDRALARLNSLVTVRQKGFVEGKNDQAIIARAESYIDQGDIQQAITELQKLDGAQAQVAEPWIEQAQARLMAEQVSVLLTSNIIKDLPRTLLPQKISPSQLGLEQ